MQFQFSSHPFVAASNSISLANIPPDVNVQLAVIRQYHPQLEHWTDQAVMLAWIQYSQNIYLHDWVGSDWIKETDDFFLAYLYVRQKNPLFDFGKVGEFSERVWELGDKHPWLRNEALPDWADSAMAA